LEGYSIYLETGDSVKIIKATSMIMWKRSQTLKWK